MPRSNYTLIGAVDMSDATDLVLERSFDIAQRYIPCEIHFISVVETKKDVDRAGLEQREQELRDRIESVASCFSSELKGTIGVHVRAGSPVEEISDLIEETRADLVIVGHHGWGKAKSRGRSVSKQLLESARSSVLIAQVPDFEDRPAPSCQDCADIRRESKGETWFCSKHTDHENGRRWYGTLSRGISIHPGVGLW